MNKTGGHLEKSKGVKFKRERLVIALVDASI